MPNPAPPAAAAPERKNCEPLAIQNFIDGQWSGGARTIPIHNPARREDVVAHVADSDAASAARAVDAAAAAFPAWAAMPAPKRGSHLAKAAQALAGRREEAATILTREEGKPLFESRGEVDRSIAILEYYAQQFGLLSGQTIPSLADRRFLFTLRAPLGPVALITPWNFPSAIPVWKAAPALLCGNTVVLKPSPRAPVSAAIFAQCLEAAGLPKGVFNLLNAADPAVAQALVDDPRICGVSFTGSLAAGRDVARRAAPRLIRVGLEMGGKNAHVVLPDADLDKAADDIAAAAFFSAGHKCTAASRAILVGDVAGPFIEKLLAKAAGLVVGDGLDPKTRVGPVIDEEHVRKILGFIAVGKEEGARLLAGGARLTGGAYDHGSFVGLTIFDDVTPGKRIAREEIFGPVLCILRAKDFDEALAIANGVDFGLSAGISTASAARALEFARRIDAGVVHINNPTAGLEFHVPFGGFKNSSSGAREMGASAIEFYTQLKTVYLDT